MRFCLIRAPSLPWSWLKWTDLSCTAENSFTGTLTVPQESQPFHRERGGLGLPLSLDLLFGFSFDFVATRWIIAEPADGQQNRYARGMAGTGSRKCSSGMEPLSNG